ncbi:unnamed protein product [Owenia fusiformis]|uniref:Ionotropic glutamate receptor C-terminal domain-containing protein n=1 Tax=Owenia fusiformis TaxID=6347 RepID=A0A8S4Q346_OWEFU|nr:unnamed protein product [Owenia fusiformis]
MTFFKQSKIPTYQRMWSFMESQEPSVFVKNSDEGISRVKEGNYAYLMESTMLDYTIQRNCDLMQVGGLLDSKGYGIGTPVGSPYRDRISMAILSLQENGKIQLLYNKWWRNAGSCNRDDKKKESKASALGVENVGGVFVVLLAGLALAVVVAIFEFMWAARKKAHKDRQSLCGEMGDELRFAVRCQSGTKRPVVRRKCSQCYVHAPDHLEHILEPPPNNGVPQLMLPPETNHKSSPSNELIFRGYEPPVYDSYNDYNSREYTETNNKRT